MTTIRVTASDILAGKMKNCDSCPIANAIDGVLRPEYMAKVFESKVQIGAHDMKREWLIKHEIPMPERAGDAIFEFDTKGTMEPFEFEIEIPNEYLIFTKQNHNAAGPGNP